MNSRFSDYVTSGAFNMALTRGQIADLSSLAEKGASYVDRWGALERRGLIERIPDVSDHLGNWDKEQWRLTAVGALVLNLLFEAGLSNRGGAALAAECEALRAQLAAASLAATDARKRLRSMHARFEKSQLKVEHLEASASRDKFPIRITPRDPMPEATVTELMEGIPE